MKRLLSLTIGQIRRKFNLSSSLPLPECHRSSEAEHSKSVERRNRNGWLRLLREGQYCSIMHPARFSREMLAYNLDGLPRDAVGRTRDVEDQLLRTGQLEKRCAELGIHAIRYRDAIPQENAMDFSEFLEK